MQLSCKLKERNREQEGKEMRTKQNEAGRHRLHYRTTFSCLGEELARTNWKWITRPQTPSF